MKWLHLLTTGERVSSTLLPSVSCSTVDVDLHACTHNRRLLVSRSALLLPVCWLCLFRCVCNGKSSGAVSVSVIPLLQWPAQRQQSPRGSRHCSAVLQCVTLVCGHGMCLRATHRQQGRPGQSCQWSSTCTWYTVLGGPVVNCDQKVDSKTHNKVESDTGSKALT